MQDQLITLETAKLAKEKGFATNTHNIYEWITDEQGNAYEHVPQSLLQRWLREKHNIAICVVNYYDNYVIQAKLREKNNPRDGIKINILSHSYEDCLEQGLIDGLRLIGQTEKYDR